MRMKTLAVIPARGGSKGIPRKNLRPFGGSPLLTWSVAAARRATSVDRVLVSTDSEEIAEVASRAGAEVHMRSTALAEDAVTLDPVVFDAVVQAEAGAGRPYDAVVTIQPTSPLLSAQSIDRALGRLVERQDIDSVLSVVDDTHLAWELHGGVARPAYAARVNRQSLPRRMRETGGILATRRGFVTAEGRLGPRVDVLPLSPTEGIDIDNEDDWLFAEAALGRRRIAFVTIGRRETGLGHVTRVMTLMESLTAHVTRAFCNPSETLAIERLTDAFFPCEVVEDDDLPTALSRFAPDIIVHDELNTRRATIEAERHAGYRVVTFEDAGEGAEIADRVFNALHPAAESDAARGRHCGPGIYILRDEFRSIEPSPMRDEVENILITFGGTDPAGLTRRVLTALDGNTDARLTVVAGKGLSDFDALRAHCEAMRTSGMSIELHRDVPMMSAVMRDADLALCSAGRTVYELVHMRVPAIVLAQNDLELRHVFAGPENGCLNLGRGSAVPLAAITAAVRSLCLSRPLRASMRARMATVDLREGRGRVVSELLGLPKPSGHPSQ